MRPSAAAGLASLPLLAGRFFPLPPLLDAATGREASGLSLEFPLGHLLTAPFSVLADLLTCAGARSDAAWLAWLLAAYWAWCAARRPGWRRALAGCAAYLACLLAFLAWAFLAPRQAARLATERPEDLVVDFHSHTSLSWDGRRGFTPEANIKWHRRAGFHAAFVTDHNTAEGGLRAKRLSRRTWEGQGYRSLEGEEVSLPGLHVAVLGNRLPIDNTEYGRDARFALKLLSEARTRYGGLAVLSLPEYWRNLPRERWEELAASGAAGFEIVNAAPKALDFPEDGRRDAVELCRRHGLFLAGATDNHGWGSASCVWNVVRLPEHASMDPDQLQAALLEKLDAERFAAVRVVVRTRRESRPWPWAALEPPLGLWSACRALSLAQTLACLAWVWAAAWALRGAKGSSIPSKAASETPRR